MNKEVVIVSAARTPIGSFLGALSTIPAPKLGAIAIRGALEKINLKPELVEAVLMGHVIQAGAGQAPARQAAIYAGIPNTVPCTTINKVCASGMKTVMQAAQAIALGDADIVVAGGMENMGVCADACAEKYEFSREAQDAYAIQSYNRSATAWDSGKFDNEVVPVEVPQRRGAPVIVSKDEEYSNVRMDKIPQLRPAFTKDGTVTAANASTINDGAGAMVLMSKDKAEALGLKPLARIKSYADAAHEHDVDYFEFNEAFSVVGLANMKILGLTDKNVNVNGGAVSLGHPLGCSGVRILITLLNILEQNNAKIGAAAICNGGGGASAMIL